MHHQVWDYCQKHTSPVDPVLNELQRQTFLRTLHPQMLSGPYQGMLLQFVSHMIRPRRILEIGTFTGYSAICLAQGLAQDGMLHTIEIDDELAPLIRTYLEKAGLTAKIHLHIGDAAQIIPTLDDTFDLVFLDAGKMDYPQHFELALPKLRPGGFLLADNVLWDGKVTQQPVADATARVLHDFNEALMADPRVEMLLLPLRDGLMLVRKR